MTLMRITSFSCDICGKELSEQQINAIGQLFETRVETKSGLSKKLKVIVSVDESSNLDVCKSCLLETAKKLE